MISPPASAMRVPILVFCATAVLTACASPWRERVVALPDETLPTSGFSALTLIPTDNPAFAYRALAERVPLVLSVWSADETAVRDACDAREPRSNGKESAAAVLVPSDNQFVLWRPALADEKVEEAMQSYARVTAQDARRPFYSDPERRNLEPAWRCFRFTRFVNRDDEVPAFDFVGQLRIGDSGDYVQVRPLRLYVAPGAERNLAIGLRLEAVWRQENTGKLETVFEPVLLAMRLKGDVEELHYFLDKYWEHYPILPVVPVSTDTRGRVLQTAPATVTLTAVEFRKPDQAKEALLRTARSAGDHLGALIAAALTAR
jgi:hypothetical protein